MDDSTRSLILMMHHSDSAFVLTISMSFLAIFNSHNILVLAKLIGQSILTQSMSISNPVEWDVHDLHTSKRRLYRSSALFKRTPAANKLPEVFSIQS